MKGVEQYLKHYAVPEARAYLESPPQGQWRNVLVIPAYKESPALFENLRQFKNTLLVLVLNRPDSDDDKHCNDDLRRYIHKLPHQAALAGANGNLHTIDASRGNHLIAIERPSPLPHKEGVGLARKMGCDIALALGGAGCIASPWIHCTDADVSLPADYFSAAHDSAPAAALTYPFQHTVPAKSDEQRAIALYEAYLHSYVDGLARAGSPYAFHTIGSCIAVKAQAYASVRGFPRRAAGEDFYLLNKLAKEGAVITPASSALVLSARISQRTPFGTGPSMAKILASESLADVELFYDSRCFDALAAILSYATVHGTPKSTLADFETALSNHSEALSALRALGIEKLLAHTARQCSDKTAFLKQFHQWLDGFRTLKLINALSDHWPRLPESRSTKK